MFLRLLQLLLNPATILTGGWRFISDLLKISVPLNIWPPALQRMFNRNPWLRDNVALLFISAFYAHLQALVGLVSAYTGIIARPFVRALEEDEQNQIPTLADLLNIATNNVPMKGPDGTLQDPRLLATQWGLHPNYFDALYAANGQIPSIGQLLDLLNRTDGGEIRGGKQFPESYVTDALRESALKDKFIPDLMELRYQLLTASDYIRLAVRDVFSPETRKKFTLDDDYPTPLTRKFQAIGYSETDAKDLWAAHWELPSPTQVYEMLHRGKLPPGISVEDYLRSADYAPAWRQALVDISYNPITRTDAKRMYKLNGDFDALVQNFRNNGYNEQDAKALAEFTRQDVSLEVQQERELLVGPVKTAALAMYKARRISEDQVRQVLANLKYPKEVVDRFIADVEFVREADHREDVANALKSAYVKALRSRDDTIALLRKAGWDGEALDSLLETWDLLREVTELQPHQTASRDLTKAEIVTAYAERIIPPETASAQLVALGYDQSETETLLAMADFKARKAELDQEVENIHLNYLRGAVDPGTASVQLDNLGVNVTRKTNLLLKWERERAKVVPDFTVAQLEGMVKTKTMPEDIAQRYLADQGYTSEQQTYLLSWWLGKRTEAALKAAAAGR